MIMKNRFFKLTLLSGLVILESCVSTSDLNGIPVKLIEINGGEMVFVATRTVNGNNLTLSQILLQERTTYGKDISLANVVEQTRQTSFFGWTINTQKFYIYDVIRNVPTISNSIIPEKKSSLDKYAKSVAKDSLNAVNSSIKPMLVKNNGVSENSISVLVNGNKLEVLLSNLPGSWSWSEAQNECKKLGVGWRLPTKIELNMLLNESSSNGIGSLENGKIWCQDASDDELYRWVLIIKDDNISGRFIDKNQKLLVRPVRNM
jgi:hypothetical protein